MKGMERELMRREDRRISREENMMKKILLTLAILVTAGALSFGQSGDRPASADANSAGAPVATPRLDADQHHDWGWLGLLGLAGLGGLAGRKRNEVAGRNRSDINEVRRAA